MTDIEISKITKYKFKSIVNKNVNKFAHNWLLNIARKQSKCSGILNSIQNETLYMQDYLKTNLLFKVDQQLLFSLRNRSYPVKSNFKYKYDNMICRTCEDPTSYEDERHLSLCVKLKDEINGVQIDFFDVFGPLQYQVKFIETFKKIDRKWKLLLELNNII